jgi:glutathionylspermidine synthase
MLGTTVFSAIYEAVAAGHLQLFNGLFGLLLQHKGLLAWLWAHRHDPCFTERERWAIRRHLPPTWQIDAYPSATGREELVAKQVFGREGEEVFFGDAVPGDAWDLLRRRRTYVAQQRIEVQQLDAVVATSRGLVSQDGYATVGCFNVREQGVGFYTRFGGRITTNRAKWLATFVETPHPGGELASRRAVRPVRPADSARGADSVPTASGRPALRDALGGRPDSVGTQPPPPPQGGRGFTEEP